MGGGKPMRFAVDTGGTFTDLVLEDDKGILHMFKAPTTPDDPVRGILDGVRTAAQSFGEAPEALLGRGELFIHGTTHATTAIVTGTTARTALLTMALVAWVVPWMNSSPRPS